jgi:hypothetical protein
MGSFSQLSAVQAGSGSLRQCVAIVPRHPAGGLGDQFSRVPLSFRQVVEGVDVREFAGVDQAHEQVPDFGSVQRAIEECIFAAMESFP